MYWMREKMKTLLITVMMLISFVSNKSEALKEASISLITLNIWGGHVEAPLMDFISKNKDIDIFCFQEVYESAKNKISTNDDKVVLDINNKIGNVLSNHYSYFAPVVNGIYGLSIFFKKDIKVVSHGVYTIHKNDNYPGRGPTHSRILQWIKISKNNKIYTIANVHGLWNGKGKSDSPNRLKQSRKIREFVDKSKNPVILCGDFNLTPDTESLKIISENMVDLIKENKISSTRTSFYKKPIRYADYIFTSAGVTVEKFKVLEDEVSDHSPIFLKFF